MTLPYSFLCFAGGYCPHNNISRVLAKLQFAAPNVLASDGDLCYTIQTIPVLEEIMTKLLLRLFVKGHKTPDRPEVRSRVGMLSGAVGIVCNALLCVLKLIVGALSDQDSIIQHEDLIGITNRCGPLGYDECGGCIFHGADGYTKLRIGSIIQR